MQFSVLLAPAAVGWYSPAEQAPQTVDPAGVFVVRPTPHARQLLGPMQLWLQYVPLSQAVQPTEVVLAVEYWPAEQAMQLVWPVRVV